MTKLNFNQLREANLERCRESYHPLDAWNAPEWACACAGELGEACNLIKKKHRGEFIANEEIAKEIADTVIYLDLLAARLGINLGYAIQYKFNEVSKRMNSEVKL